MIINQCANCSKPLALNAPRRAGGVWRAKDAVFGLAFASGLRRGGARGAPSVGAAGSPQGRSDTPLGPRGRATAGRSTIAARRHRRDPTDRCVRCHTRYCNATCQHAHWKDGHKLCRRKLRRVDAAAPAWIIRGPIRGLDRPADRSGRLSQQATRNSARRSLEPAAPKSTTPASKRRRRPPRPSRPAPRTRPRTRAATSVGWQRGRASCGRARVTVPRSKPQDWLTCRAWCGRRRSRSACERIVKFPGRVSRCVGHGRCGRRQLLRLGKVDSMYCLRPKIPRQSGPRDGLGVLEDIRAARR